MEKSGTRGRPLSPIAAGEMVALSVSIAAEEKTAAVEAATAAGRSLSREVEHRLRWYRDQESRFGGPRIMALLSSLASAALRQHPAGEGAWIDDPENYNLVIDEWYELLENAAPVSVAAKIARGRELIAALATVPPHLQWRWRTMLRHLAALSRLPDEVRAEFAAAAEPPAVEPPTEDEVRATAEAWSLPLPKAREVASRLRALGPTDVEFQAALDDAEERLFKEAQPFMRAWLVAAQVLAGAAGRLPDDDEIAAYFSSSAELHILAGLLHGRRPAADLLQHRARILALLDKHTAG